MPTNETTRILRSIQSYATAAIILTAAIITLIAVYPLYTQLESAEKKGVMFARDLSAIIVDGYLSHLKDIAKQVSSRTKASQIVEEYKEGRITKKQMTQFLNTVFQSALGNSKNLVGITRMTLDGKVLAQAGKSIPTILMSKNKSKNLQMRGPELLNKKYYICIKTPVFTPKKRQVATDLTLFNITDLQENIDKNMQNHPGKTLIAYLKNKEPQILYPLHTAWGKNLKKESLLYNALQDATIKRKTGLVSGQESNIAIYIAHAPTHQKNWSVAIVVKKTALLATIQKTLWTILAFITIAVIIFIPGLEFFLKPISSRILIAQEDLEKQINNSHKKLQHTNDQLQHLADHDILTNTLNRRGFFAALGREISRAKRHQEMFSLILLDLNNLKEINEKNGQDAGDILLIKTAERIANEVRKEDIISRIGGDKFAIIMPEMSMHNSKDIIEKICTTIKQPLKVQNKLIHYSASIGSATYPTQGITSREIMQFAEAAIHEYKNNCDTTE